MKEKHKEEARPIVIRRIVSRKNFSLHTLFSSLLFSFPFPFVLPFPHRGNRRRVLYLLFLFLFFSLSPLLFTFIRGKLEPPIIAGEIIKKAGAGEILKRRREGRPLSAGRYRSTAMLGSTSSHPLCISVSFRRLLLFSLSLSSSHNTLFILESISLFPPLPPHFSPCDIDNRLTV